MSKVRTWTDGQPLSPGALRQVLSVTLPAITERLAASLTGAATGEPNWSELEWRIARAVAVIHGISPLLSRRLEWTGAPGWRTFLEQQRDHTAVRYGRMATLLDRIHEQAAQANIAFVPLKGAALHALKIYEAGDRPMADIDLLVKLHDLPAMSALLGDLGYRTISTSAHEHVLVPREGLAQIRMAEHADNAITVEAHAAISHCMPVRQVDITADLWTLAPRPGRNDYPSLAALMRHLLMHTAVNMQVRIVRMIQLQDIALLAPRLSASDWSELLGRTAPWWALPPLQLMRRYYPGAIPAPAFAAAERACPALLRIAAPRLRLAEVSVANSRRPVFPAIMWVNSLSEALNWLGMRSKQGLLALSGAQRLPEATEIQPWITRPHRRRALELLLRRPRPETLRMVTAALGGDPAFASNYEQPNAA
jgi:Uncharacterised nucleotidyltransferase